jgi:DNA-binding transcriptional regulator YiaG
MTPHTLRAARIAARLTQRAAAELIGADVMTVSRWERGVYTCPPRRAKHYLAILEKKKKICNPV